MFIVDPPPPPPPGGVAVSVWHIAEQPSPEIRFPSSHVSPRLPSIIPSPQIPPKKNPSICLSVETERFVLPPALTETTSADAVCMEKKISMEKSVNIKKDLNVNVALLMPILPLKNKA